MSVTTSTPRRRSSRGSATSPGVSKAGRGSARAAGRSPSANPAPTPYAVAARELLRETLFDGARRELESRGWSEVTMADIAAAAGVSRQTLYNEFGSRDDFAQALALREAVRFVRAIEGALDAHLDEPKAALTAAFDLFLRAAAEDPLIRAAIGGTGEMLPFVTTQGQPLVQGAAERLCEAMRARWPEASEHDAALLAECLVRLAISYATLPVGPAIDAVGRESAEIEPAETAETEPAETEPAETASVGQAVAAVAEVRQGVGQAVGQGVGVGHAAGQGVGHAVGQAAGGVGVGQSVGQAAGQGAAMMTASSITELLGPYIDRALGDRARGPRSGVALGGRARGPRSGQRSGTMPLNRIARD